MLSDLLENQRSHPFFHDWQSDTNKQTAAHLLLSIWMVRAGRGRGSTAHVACLCNCGMGALWCRIARGASGKPSYSGTIR